MTAAPIDLSPKQLSAEELDEIKTFVVESWSPWRVSLEVAHLEALLRHVAWLEEQAARRRGWRGRFRSARGDEREWA